MTQLLRKSEPTIVDAIRFLPVSSPVSVGSRPPVLYEVGDSFPIEASSVQCQNGTKATEHPEFMAVVCRIVFDDSYILPSMRPLIVFPPIPGTGTYGGGSIRLSVVFWEGEFWVPILAMEPERPALFETLYGTIDGWGLDVLYRVEAKDVPSIVGAIGRKFDDPAIDGWIS